MTVFYLLTKTKPDAVVFCSKKSRQKLATNFAKIQVLCSNFKMHHFGSKQNTYM